MKIDSEKMVFIINLLKLSHDAPDVLHSCLDMQGSEVIWKYFEIRAARQVFDETTML